MTDLMIRFASGVFSGGSTWACSSVARNAMAEPICGLGALPVEADMACPAAMNSSAPVTRAMIATIDRLRPWCRHWGVFEDGMHERSSPVCNCGMTPIIQTARRDRYGAAGLY